MGQYYFFANFDKGEYIYPHEYDNGSKLMEFSYQGNNYMNALETLLKNHWAGDRVVCIGDYIDEYYKDGPCPEFLQDLCYECGLTLDEKRDGYSYNLYSYVRDFFTNSYLNIPEPFIPARYIYDTQRYIFYDCKNQPIQWSGVDDNLLYGTKIHPLSLLLCAGNGSGGSYYGPEQGAVGICADHGDEIVLSDKPISDYSHFKEDNTKFTEKQITNSNIEILKNTIKTAYEDRIDISNLQIDKALFLDDTEISVLKNYAEHISK